MQNFSITQWLSKLQAKSFCECLYIAGQSNYSVIIAVCENMWSGMMNEGPSKYYKSQNKNKGVFLVFSKIIFKPGFFKKNSFWMVMLNLLFKSF